MSIDVKESLTDIYDYIKELERMLCMVDLDTHWDDDDDERFDKAINYLKWMGEMDSYIEERFEEVIEALTKV